MLLYKYRSLTNIEYVLDIIVNQRLYCSPYEQLNDPFEGQFQTILSVPYHFCVGSSAGDPLVKYKESKSISDLGRQTNKTRVCSLSSSPTDVRLWSFYADGHKGIAFEVDFSDIQDHVKEVRYTTTLPEFGTTILGGATPEDVLTCKTDHWEFEKEYRIIGADPFFRVEGRIKRIIAGHRTPESLLELIRRILPPEIISVRASLNQDSICVSVGRSKDSGS
ncbi:MAG: DUF2971 domain-containing protein [Geobacter sp.]|nr:MAG: DUF2971 domain-containing protein [Geobacter sp.]